MLALMRRLLTPRWLALHLLMTILVTSMLGLAGWQLWRAAGGNPLSWGYTIQWPVFAGFVVFIWAREARGALRVGRADRTPVAAPEGGEATGDPATGRPPARRPVVTRRVATYGDSAYDAAYGDPAADPELAAYNDYLAWLNAHPGARPSDYPGYRPPPADRDRAGADRDRAAADR